MRPVEKGPLSIKELHLDLLSIMLDSQMMKLNLLRDEIKIVESVFVELRWLIVWKDCIEVLKNLLFHMCFAFALALKLRLS